MGLDEAAVELIRASWVPAREDSVGAGVLLFKGLFTKFPDYLKFFSQFEQLDLERLRENKRLVKHAVKVIETVTFVVDSIGDPAKDGQLSEALVALVRGHLKRRIGLREFRNLGIVLIDFICQLNNRRAGRAATDAPGGAGGNPALGAASSSASSSQDSETMTSALDKIQASSSPSSSSEDESLLARTSATSLEDGECARGLDSARGHGRPDGDVHGQSPTGRPELKLDTGRLVSAWTQMYGTILDLVKSEEEADAGERAEVAREGGQ